MILRNNAKWMLMASPLLLGCISNAMADSLAGPSGELTVTGTYLPPPCDVTLANNGTIDFGRIPASSLNSTAYTKLPIKTLTNAVTISCPSMTSVGITSQDNRVASVIIDQTMPMPNTMPYGNGYGLDYFGLGVDSASNKIGIYMSQFQNLKADGVSGYFGGSFPSTPFSSTAPQGLSPAQGLGNTPYGGFIYNFYDSTGTILSAKLYTMDYTVSPVIAPTSSLNISRDVVLDGSITVSFYYL
ncbi:DUF1120 domain-containing protein [Obesumbacterium proteus]|uniref:Beta-fimbriae putative major subunit n=1 Tax=Obesumbacterium proteus ATCC 12841 TaxID=1354268 RepID=A0AA91EF93_9GAMM|nr:DUF1120 domain-containing protein [Obesumbacterium proteus]AMO82582.1 hypothetical protein DSM2777_17000 [Obesumbacterium proteus]OAT57662.1 beta-fimbriae putative major subunit [Obesumbacterium proteus ATCC 12841]